MFRDAWRVGSEAGTASGREGTHGEKRIDFVFFKGDNLSLTGVQTVDLVRGRSVGPSPSGGDA